MITLGNQPVHLEGEQLQVGQTMPDFITTLNSLEPFDSRTLTGKKVYLSVPSVDTPVCSMELSRFIQDLNTREDVTCVSVSMDLPFALDRWCQAKQNEKVITTSDYKLWDFAKKTGTRIQENGLLARAVFVVDENNIITHVEYVQEVTCEPNYQAVYEKL